MSYNNDAMGILSRYKKELVKAEGKYKAIKTVLCPYFGKSIPFTSDGFHHLKFNTSESERSKQAQMHKFKFIEEAAEILSKSGTVQEYRKQWGAIGSRRYSSGMRETKEMQYWGFVGILGSGESAIRVKAIVRQVGNGEPHFWSVMSDTNLKARSNFKLASENIENE